MQNKLEIIRWLLVIPSAFIGWYLAFFIGVLLYSAVDSFCPRQEFDSPCIASWYFPVIDAVIIFGASLSAVFTILFAVLIAPKKRDFVAKIIFLGGVVTAIYFVANTSAWAEFTGAIICGLLTLALVLRHENKTETT